MFELGIAMSGEDIVFEAPKYGNGYECDQRPVDVQKVNRLTDGIAHQEAQLLKEFASLLRQTLAEYPQLKRADKVERLKQISRLSESYGAQDLFLLVNAMTKKPSDSAMVAKLTKLCVYTINFISSVSRV